jgi:hypothetical protein
MALGSVAMWLGVPLGLVYAASRLEDSTQPSMGPYLLVLLGVPAGMVLIGKALGALGRFYDARTGAVAKRRQTAWLRSMRGERPGSAGTWRVLDAVMLWSVATALACFAIWFFVFAGSSI